MAALVAAIHVFRAAIKDMDGRHKAGHDDEERAPLEVRTFCRKAVGEARAPERRSWCRAQREYRLAIDLVPGMILRSNV
jgi:hypothetical protein